MTKYIWQRYFLKEILKVFFLFLFVFYFLYAFIDYSSRFQEFSKESSISALDSLKYYGYQFIKRLDLLIPLALMISTIKVLITLNTRRELVALQAAGIPIRTLLRPFFFVSGACISFLLLAQETIMPPSLSAIDEFQMMHFHKSSSQDKNKSIRIFSLKDGSKLFCQSFNLKTHTFEDVIWVISIHDIWRAKSVKIEDKAPIAYYADHILRTPEGTLEKKESFAQVPLENLKWDDALLFNTKKPIDNYSISALSSMLKDKQVLSAQEEVDTKISILSKVAMCFLSFLVVLATVPYCIRYSRQTSYFLVYSLAIFGFVAFFTMMDAMVVLAENHVLPPSVTILTPFLLLGSIFSVKFIKATS